MFFCKENLRNSHLNYVHQTWKHTLFLEDIAIDATCGNGKDTLFLASLVPKGKVIALDIQLKSIEKTKNLLGQSNKNVTFYHMCHSNFPKNLSPSSIKLIIYNLGYLPGSDKSITTKVQTTLQSVEKALLLIQPGGLISITCYPGHKEGEEEEKALLLFSKSLCKKTWLVSYTQWINREKNPSVLFFKKSEP